MKFERINVKRERERESEENKRKRVEELNNRILFLLYKNFKIENEVICKIKL